MSIRETLANLWEGVSWDSTVRWTSEKAYQVGNLASDLLEETYDHFTEQIHKIENQGLAHWAKDTLKDSFFEAVQAIPRFGTFGFISGPDLSAIEQGFDLKGWSGALNSMQQQIFKPAVKFYQWSQSQVQRGASLLETGVQVFHSRDALYYTFHEHILNEGNWSVANALTQQFFEESLEGWRHGEVLAPFQAFRNTTGVARNYLPSKIQQDPTYAQLISGALTLEEVLAGKRSLAQKAAGMLIEGVKTYAKSRLPGKLYSLPIALGMDVTAQKAKEKWAGEKAWKLSDLSGEETFRWILMNYLILQGGKNQTMERLSRADYEKRAWNWINSYRQTLKFYFGEEAITGEASTYHHGSGAALNILPTRSPATLFRWEEEDTPPPVPLFEIDAITEIDAEEGWVYLTLKGEKSIKLVKISLEEALDLEVIVLDQGEYVEKQEDRSRVRISFLPKATKE